MSRDTHGSRRRSPTDDARGSRRSHDRANRDSERVGHRAATIAFGARTSAIALGATDGAMPRRSLTADDWPVVLWSAFARAAGTLRSDADETNIGLKSGVETAFMEQALQLLPKPGRRHRGPDPSRAGLEGTRALAGVHADVNRVRSALLLPADAESYLRTILMALTEARPAFIRDNERALIHRPALRHVDSSAVEIGPRPIAVFFESPLPAHPFEADIGTWADLHQAAENAVRQLPVIGDGNTNGDPLRFDKAEARLHGVILLPDAEGHLSRRAVFLLSPSARVLRSDRSVAPVDPEDSCIPVMTEVVGPLEHVCSALAYCAVQTLERAELADDGYAGPAHAPTIAVPGARLGFDVTTR